jgi:hypothetical protein
MPHTFDVAPTGRAKCRACESKIAAGLPRFGESVPNPYADDGSLTTHWYHVACAAYARPESFLEGLAAAAPDQVECRDALEAQAKLGVAHHRVARGRRVERAATGRASCRHCREAIEKDAWRIALVYYEDGRFTPAGFIHLRCAGPYLETAALMPRLRHFTSELTDADAAEVAAGLSGL